jgi:hypothetical protein
LWSFGVGAVVDLPNFSVMVLGLDDWEEARGRPIAEDRLLAAIHRGLGAQVARLLAPPRAPDSEGPYDPFGDSARIGVPVTTFPEWFRCPICQLLAPLETRLFEFKPNPYRPDQARYVHALCSRAKGKPPTAVPARFLVACERGHMDDFPWAYFVHRGQPACTGTLKFYEVGASLETANLWVECNECGKKRSMVEAFGQRDEPALPACRGRHPHLREASGHCSEPLKAILLGASNSWFPETRSVLSVPSRAGRLAQLVEEKWLYLGNATSLDVLRAFLHSPGFSEFAGFDEREIWQEIESRRAEAGEGAVDDDEEVDLKAPEWEVFSKPDPALNGKDFWLTDVPAPPMFSKLIESVVLGERLREVNALIGFTRIRFAGESNLGEARVRRAPLADQPPTWVPATEVRGEGVFLRFDLHPIADWARRDGSKSRERLLRDAHRGWRSARRLEPAEAGFPGNVYAMLHSLSHALMREFSLECGYNAASIRERIYAPTGEGGDRAGLLIYTAAPDSEGTLGGLVSLGRPEELGRLLAQALERARLCASDPLCSEHDPSKDGTLHGAACHACIFAPETSCEIGNRYLDRAVIVPTFRSADAAFLGATGA